jgi:hypothetical protein
MIMVIVMVNVVGVCDNPLVQAVAGVSLASAAVVSVWARAVTAGKQRVRMVYREVV